MNERNPLTKESTAERLSGSCLCGSIQHEVYSPFLRFAHCYCSRCRKATGTGHASNLYCAPERFAWLQGEHEVARYDLPSAHSFATVFARCCGCPLPRLTRSGRKVVVPAGSLDVMPRTIAPQYRIFWASRTDWSYTGDDLPCYDELPEGWR